MARLVWLDSHPIAILAAARAASGARSPTTRQSNCLSCLSTQRQVPPPLAPLTPQLPPPNSDGPLLTFALCVSQAKDDCGVLLITAALLARICAAVLCGFIVLYFRGWLRCGF